MKNTKETKEAAIGTDRNRHSRSILPIPDVQKPGLTTFDAEDPDSRFPPIETVLPPAGAPNVLVILLDDVGFGSSSAFGGPYAFEQTYHLPVNSMLDPSRAPLRILENLLGHDLI